MQHLISLEDMDRDRLLTLLDRAQQFAELDARAAQPDSLAGVHVVNLFFEPSTRTRLSFEIAAHRLGADVVNFDAERSSTLKGETLADTFRTVEAMGAQLFIVRHGDSGACELLSELAGSGTHIVNAGEGRNAHPTQGLLDMLTIRQFSALPFEQLSVAIIGDIRHSRVARSDLHALRALGCRDIRVCAPDALLPDAGELHGYRVIDVTDDALRNADVVMTLRLQRERMEDGLVDSLEGYYAGYGIDQRRLSLAKPDAFVMHPGPMNRGVEIESAVADGPRSAILRQVANGVAVRMAVMEALVEHCN
ncbi:MAG: aspartate carbamoyltransferase catalytic subunit [Xanthomonadales bacterium]|nr:aspartate carbamoyltransferase catalytic subunit [Xanthomonadales bacterium]